MARARKKNTKDEHVILRVRTDVKRRWKTAARKNGESLSEFLTRAGNVLADVVETRQVSGAT